MVSWLYFLLLMKKNSDLKQVFLLIILHFSLIEHILFNDTMKSLHKLQLWIFFENTSLYWQFLEHSRNVFYCFVRFSSIQLIFLGSTLVWQKLYHITIQYICWITQPIINPIRGLLLSIHNSYIVTNIASHTNSIHFIFFFYR